MKMLIRNDPVQAKYETSCRLKAEMIRKFKNGTLSERHIAVVVAEVFKLGVEAGKRY